MTSDLVLVTGGSGFVGSHCILALLREGYRVRTTVRSLDREAEVRAMMTRGGQDAADRLTFVEADLLDDDGWDAAVDGCTYVLHVASPFPVEVPRDPNELVRPAREGTQRVLRAAHRAGVRRVVLTSSFAAVGYGVLPGLECLTEEDWTRLDGPIEVGPYARSKTLAELAAWEFVSDEGRGMELSTVNPVAVFGPLLGPDASTSVEVVRRLVDGALPGLPNISIGVVDVRDVADLHVLAMTSEAAAGERFLAISGDYMPLHQVAEILRVGLATRAKKIPSRRLPDWLVRVVGTVDAGVKQIVPELGVERHVSATKARGVLGWEPRKPEVALVATAETLLELREEARDG